MKATEREDDDELPVFVDLSGVPVPDGMRRARLWCTKEHHEHDVWVDADRGSIVGESDDTKPTAEAMRAQAPELEPGLWRGRVKQEIWSGHGPPFHVQVDAFEIEILGWCYACTTWKVTVSPTRPGQAFVSCGWKIKELAATVAVMEKVR